MSVLLKLLEAKKKKFILGLWYVELLALSEGILHKVQKF